MAEARRTGPSGEKVPGRKMAYADVVAWQNESQRVFEAARRSIHENLQVKVPGNSSACETTRAMVADVAFLIDRATPREPTSRLTTRSRSAVRLSLNA